MSAFSETRALHRVVASYFSPQETSDVFQSVLIEYAHTHTHWNTHINTYRWTHTHIYMIVYRRMHLHPSYTQEHKHPPVKTIDESFLNIFICSVWREWRNNSHLPSIGTLSPPSTFFLSLTFPLSPSPSSSLSLLTASFRTLCECGSERERVRDVWVLAVTMYFRTLHVWWQCESKNCQMRKWGMEAGIGVVIVLPSLSLSFSLSSSSTLSFLFSSLFLLIGPPSSKSGVDSTLSEWVDWHHTSFIQLIWL